MGVYYVGVWSDRKAIGKLHLRKSFPLCKLVVGVIWLVLDSRVEVTGVKQVK